MVLRLAVKTESCSLERVYTKQRPLKDSAATMRRGGVRVVEEDLKDEVHCLAVDEAASRIYKSVVFTPMDLALAFSLLHYYFFLSYHYLC